MWPCDAQDIFKQVLLPCANQFSGVHPQAWSFPTAAEQHVDQSHSRAGQAKSTGCHGRFARGKDVTDGSSCKPRVRRWHSTQDRGRGGNVKGEASGMQLVRRSGAFDERIQWSEEHGDMSDVRNGWGLCIGERISPACTIPLLNEFPVYSPPFSFPILVALGDEGIFLRSRRAWSGQG